MDDNTNIVTYRQDVHDEISKYVKIKKVKPDFINAEGELETELDGYDFFILIEKVEVSRIKKMSSQTVAKKNIVTLEDFRKLNTFNSFNDLIENFYEKKSFHWSTNEVVVLVPPLIDIFKFNTEEKSDFIKRCLLFFNNQDYYELTPVINATIKSVREFRHISLVKKNNEGENEILKIEKRAFEEEDPTYLPILYHKIISLGDLLINKGINKFIILPPPNDIDYRIEMEEYKSENEKNDYYDWQELGDEETNRWDEETGGSWRIENDFG